MNIDEKNRLKTLTKNINNITVLIDELFMPLEQLMTKNNYTLEQAVNHKNKTEQFLKKYATFTLNSITKSILQLANK